MDKVLNSCCFTGHRFVLYEHEIKLRKALSVVITGLYERGCRIFLSGGAVGFDSIAAEEVIELRKRFSDIKLHMVLPCRNQHRKWGASDRLKYEKLLTEADDTNFLCETYCTGCMHLRNKYLVDNSQVCIAYYNHSGGGTEYTVNYAREKEREIINLAYEI